MPASAILELPKKKEEGEGGKGEAEDNTSTITVAVAVAAVANRSFGHRVHGTKIHLFQILIS